MTTKEARDIAIGAITSADPEEAYDQAAGGVLAALAEISISAQDAADISRDAAQWAVYKHAAAEGREG
jgi:predicted ATP-grasp superfamily ATP-dependent carboligase